MLWCVCVCTHKYMSATPMKAINVIRQTYMYGLSLVGSNYLDTLWRPSHPPICLQAPAVGSAVFPQAVFHMEFRGKPRLGCVVLAQTFLELDLS